MNQELVKIKTALISVSDKTNLDRLAQFLLDYNIQMISTGGTQKYLENLGFAVTPAESLTNNPEAFGGRMKSISFQISSGLLYRRYHEQDQFEAEKLNIQAIDLVVCNLYPFEEQIKKNETDDVLIENIDIGGPLMLRASAKNFEAVTVLSDVSDYDNFIEHYLKHSATTFEFRQQQAVKTFTIVANYDQIISQEMAARFLSKHNTSLDLIDKISLRYGENPHQQATLSILKNTDSKNTLTSAVVLQGKELSYNNWLDMDSAWRVMSDVYHLLSQTQFNCVTAVVKHANPCGLSSAQNSFDSLMSAWNGDHISSFGGIIACSYKIELKHAEFLTKNFIEVLIAPEFSEEAIQLFETKKNVRLVQIAPRDFAQKEKIYRSISGGMLEQNEDELSLNTEQQKVVTQKDFKNISTNLILFGLVACKFLKSNGIALVAEKNGIFNLVAAGMGQPNRLDSLRLLAHERLKNKKNESFKDVVLISDAFFPFADSIDVCAELGIQYVVQPGGSIKDKEVIACCDRHGVAMMMTGLRHFRH